MTNPIDRLFDGYGERERQFYHERAQARHWPSDPDEFLHSRAAEAGIHYDLPDPTEIDEVIEMLKTDRSAEFTPRQQEVAEWIVGWSDVDDGPYDDGDTAPPLVIIEEDGEHP